MRIKKWLTVWVFLLMASCGGSDVSIGVNSGYARLDIGADLALTVSVDEGRPDGFTTRVGREGATISLNSGQRLRITADKPTSLTLTANGADIDLISSSSTIWEGIVSSPVNTRVSFRFSSLYQPGATVFLTVDVKP